MISCMKGEDDIIYYDGNFTFHNYVSDEWDEDSGIDEIRIIYNLNQDIEWKKKNDYTEHEELISMKQGEICIFRCRPGNLKGSLKIVFHKKKQWKSKKKPIKMDKRDIRLLEGLREDIQLRPAEDYSIDRISSRLGISKNKLSKMFNDIYGITIHSYVLDRRLEYASILFKAGYKNVTEVATRSGYNNMSYFAREFAKKFGTTPKNYSKMVMQE